MLCAVAKVDWKAFFLCQSQLEGIFITPYVNVAIANKREHHSCNAI